MSGEARVLLVAEAGSIPYRVVARLAELGPALPPFAVIGGLAVITRLGQAHRATNDIDTVSDDQVGLVDWLVAAGFDRQGRQRAAGTGPQARRDRRERRRPRLSPVSA